MSTTSATLQSQLSSTKPLIEKPISNKLLYNKLRRKAFDLLARREHSRKELTEKLIERVLMKESDREELVEDTAARTINHLVLVEKLMDTLAEEGLQSDGRYVEMYIRSRILKGMGPKKIAHELELRGISFSQFEEELDMNNDGWLEQAEKVRQKKFGVARDLYNKLSFEDKAKQNKFLQYRGFTTEQIRKINLLNLC